MLSVGETFDYIISQTKAKQNGSGWKGYCPAHQDRNPSLSIGYGDNGGIVAHCHAGCEPAAIVAALGLTMADLFPPRLDAVRQNGHRRIPTQTTRYPLRDASGAIVAAHVRQDFPDGTKAVHWEQPNGRNGLDGIGTAALPLYGIHEMGDASQVVVCEGEKAADALRAVGIPAVGTVTGAASIPGDDSLRPLIGRRVCLWPDNDAQGHRHMARIAEQLRVLGQGADSIRRVGWDAAPDKGDAADWRGTADALRALMADAPLWETAPKRPAKAGRESVGVMACDVTPERVEWLSPGRLARGKSTMMDGDPGLGKSTLSLELAARITRGDALPGGRPAPPRGVVILSAEDGIADTIVPRLMAAGADLSRVFILTGIAVSKDVDDAVTVPGGLDAVEHGIRRVNAALLIIDPLVAFLGQDVNSGRDQDVRRALAPLVAMLERTGCAGLLLRHLNKATGAQALYRGGGSIAIIGGARFGLLVARDPDDDDALIVAGTKANLGPKSPALRYRLVGVPSTDVARVVWDSEPVNFDAGALLAATAGGTDDGDGSALDEAREWLKSFLQHEQQRAPVVTAQARKDGIAERTLHRAKKALGVKSRRDGPDWVWRLPGNPANPPVAAPSPESIGNVGNLGNVDENPRNHAENQDCQGCQDGQDCQHCQHCQGTGAGNLGNVVPLNPTDAAIVATAENMAALSDDEWFALLLAMESEPVGEDQDRRWDAVALAEQMRSERMAS